MTGEQALTGGFDDPARDAAVAFRALLGAMPRPGTIETCDAATAPSPMSQAGATALAALCDPDTPVFLAGPLDTPDIRNWLAFHTGAPLTGPERCRFAIGPWQALLPLHRYPQGSPEYPDRSATLIIEMAQIAPTGARLTGPGIADAAALSLPEVAAFQTNAMAFPCGLDFFLTAGDRIAALPRTTKVE